MISLTVSNAVFSEHCSVHEMIKNIPVCKIIIFVSTQFKYNEKNSLYILLE